MRRFGATAERLDILAAGHPMEDWLRFMGRLARAQHVATTSGPAPDALPQSAIAQAVAAGLPPLAADGHRRSASWHSAFVILHDHLDTPEVPAPAREAIAALHVNDASAREQLADAFLHGRVVASDAASALYVAAALQVYFVRMAARLPQPSLQLLPQRGLCPACGSTPSAGFVTASGATPGTRYLHCSLCATAWNHVRAVCITCGDSKSVTLEGVEGDNGVVKAETCKACHTYSKMIYQKQDMKADPFADDLASLGLDMLIAEAGWSRHAPHPLLLVG
ncbi:formate dehydrogenase accessory protein FdhE [Bradyrhizobium sp. STM 3557]|uniref:formate dehydrogenase accessory protein FdhE n=1 Tax=Bradyrhizobium sp. STM 3557 TaxID=578920 RepID=UPI00388E8984